MPDLRAVSVAVAITLSFVAPGQPSQRDAREDYDKATTAGSILPPAQARYTAWFETRHFAAWHDGLGSEPAWQEMGPKVIEHGWGDMENAGRTCAIAFDPRDKRVMYLGAASGGIWKSIDEAGSWRPVGDQVASLCVGCITLDPINPDIIYAGTGEPNNSADSFQGAGMLRSRDAGRTWELLGADVFIGYKFSRIVADPKRPGMIYAATSRGLYRSTDYGGTWVEVLHGVVTDALMDPSSPNTLIAALGFPWGRQSNGLYRTTDSGETWTKLQGDLDIPGQDLGRIQMDQCLAYPNVIYASLYGHTAGLKGFFKSTDFGHSWIRLPNTPSYSGDSAWYTNWVAVSPTNPNVVFVCGPSTWRTLDGGETWEDNTKSYSGGPVHPDHHAVMFSLHDPKTAYLCTDGGVFRTRDLGESWQSVNNGLATVQFQSVDVHPWDDRIAYGGTQDNGTLKLSETGDWAYSEGGDGGFTRVNWINPNVVYGEYVNLALYKSIDGGKHWDWNSTRGIDPTEGKLFYSPFNLDPNDPDTLVCGAERVYRSVDAEATWTAISPKLGSRVSAVVIAPSVRKVVYAGTSDGKVWVTPNLGSDWFNVTKGLPRGFVNDICVDPRNARTVYVALGGWNDNRIWKSTDAGGTWKDIGADLPPLPIQAVALNPNHPDVVYIGTSIGVFVSEHGGGRWMKFGKGLPNCPVFSIVANRKTGWITVGTHGRGAWRIPLP